MTLYGIDVSSHQGTLNGKEIAGEGFSFAVVKATQGTGYTNPFMAQQTGTLLDTGLAVAQYHFLERGDGRAQAEHYLRTADLSLSCAIDVEKDPETGTRPSWQDVEDFRALVHGHVPSVGVYINPTDWALLGAPDLSSWDWVWKADYPYAHRDYASVLYNQAPDWGWTPLGGHAIDLWQFASTAVVAGQEMDVNAYRGTSSELCALWHPTTTIEERTAVEKVLDYSRDQITQDTGYYCGPASAQTIIRAATGKVLGEAQLAKALKTTVNGTDYVGLFPPVLNAEIPGARYVEVYTTTDPLTREQKQTFWDNIVSSIDAGFGVVVNIDAPTNNYPKAVAPSTIHPKYSGGEVLHYIAAMGYADDDQRRVWIADSGFTPYGYWISFDQLATLVTPKGYVYATNPQKQETGSSDMNLFKQLTEWITAFVGPIGSDAKDIREQITGGRDKGQYGGWTAARLLKAVRDKGYDKLTLVDMLALLVWGTDDDRTKARQVGEKVK